MIIPVHAGADLQAAINSAAFGDTLVLDAGATWHGNYVLPVKTGTGVVTITSAQESPPNVRVSPASAAGFPVLVSPSNDPALMTAPSAHHYQIQCLALRCDVGNDDIVRLGDGSPAQNQLSLVPHDLVVDRCFLSGGAGGQKRGIALNSAATSILNSYITGIKFFQTDSQAICGWNGPGPFVINNNYLSAAGENLLFGGSDASIPNLVATNITIVSNWFTKDLALRNQLGQWNVKNLLELKNAQRVSVSLNTFENCWGDAQDGSAILFTPRNQDGGNPWTVVQDVQFVGNVVRHVAAVFNILGTDDTHPSLLTNKIRVSHNLCSDVSGAWNGAGRFLLIQGGNDIWFDHNAIDQDGWSVVSADGPPVTGFKLTNNIWPDYNWGIMGTNHGAGNDTIAAYFPNSAIVGNVMIMLGADTNPANYPTGNFFPTSIAQVAFDSTYQVLDAESPFRAVETDGTNPGA